MISPTPRMVHISETGENFGFIESYDLARCIFYRACDGFTEDFYQTVRFGTLGAMIVNTRQDIDSMHYCPDLEGRLNNWDVWEHLSPCLEELVKEALFDKLTMDYSILNPDTISHVRQVTPRGLVFCVKDLSEINHPEYILTDNAKNPRLYGALDQSECEMYYDWVCSILKLNEVATYNDAYDKFITPEWIKENSDKLNRWQQNTH